MKYRVYSTFGIVLAAAFALASTASASTACSVVYTISPQSSSQFGVALTIQNTGTTAWTSWTLTWTYANGQTISSLWNGNESQSGSNVTVSSESYNGSVAAGSSVTGVGFNGNWNGTTNAVPTNFAVNGTACNGGSTGPSGSFTLTPASSSVSVSAGSSTTDAITVNDLNGFTGTPTLSANSSNSGVSATVSGNTISISASSSASGSATITVNGTSGSLSASTTINVTVGTSSCTPTAITGYISVNGTWNAETSATVASGSTVNIGPQPVSGGSWAWTGPNGFSSTSRETGNLTLSGGTNTYTATYTNANGCTSTQAFTITAPTTCAATAITNWIYANGAWNAETSATVASGSTVNIGPQPLSGGSWSWSGPNGYTSTAREIDSIPLSAGTNTYTATYTNSCGTKSTQAYTIAVESVSIDMSLYGGTPTYRASGFIYGISQDVTTPVASLQSQINTRLMRAGGSQIGCPNGGWINGQFTPRWTFVQAYYQRAASVGATYVMILPGLWGADGVCNVPSYPGDNGDWTSYNNFLSQVIAAAKAAGMTGSNVQWDIWNEPDGGFWGGRSESQYLAMWKLGYQTIRAAIPNAVITGPSSAGLPFSSNSWWTTYLSYIQANNVIPNYLGWHEEGGGNDPVSDANGLANMLPTYNIPTTSFTGFEVNEYGTAGAEQQPGPSAWYIARYERANVALAARGNWGMVGQTPSLFDTMGWLVTSGADQPMGQWWVYQRYAEQTGLRTEFTPSADSEIDGIVFQDSSAKKSIAVIGNKAGGPTGNINVTYNNIPAWLVSNGTTNVLVESMPSTNAYVSAPTTVSNSAVVVSGNSITVTINWTNALDAYAITLTP